MTIDFDKFKITPVPEKQPGFVHFELAEAKPAGSTFYVDITQILVKRNADLCISGWCEVLDEDSLGDNERDLYVRIIKVSDKSCLLDLSWNYDLVGDTPQDEAESAISLGFLDDDETLINIIGTIRTGMQLCAVEYMLKEEGIIISPDHDQAGFGSDPQ